MRTTLFWPAPTVSGPNCSLPPFTVSVPPARVTGVAAPIRSAVAVRLSRVRLPATDTLPLLAIVPPPESVRLAFGPTVVAPA